MYDDIIEVLNADYDHETPYIPMSKAFNRKYKAFIKKQISPYGYEIVGDTKGYCGWSGYITNGDKYLYVHSGDWRFNEREYHITENNDVFTRVLVRSAKNEHDYTGGGNHFIELCRIGEVAHRYLEEGIIY